ncbi:MAG: phosphate ABC transporter permease PstA [Bacteroidales bacterium]|nr:phosphate ABC transporter permease PstA [Bacteroidales bacterium]
MNRRRIEEIIFRTLMFLATMLMGGVLILILIAIFRNGLPSLTWEMLTQPPKGGYYFGREGGIANAILGSLYLSLGAVALALIIALPVALFLNIHMKNYERWVNIIRFLMDTLWGIPSIVYGAFAFMIMIALGMKASLLAGIVTVALFILPIMIRSMDEVIRGVPDGLLEAGLSLGANRTEVAFLIFIRQCSTGFVTAILLALGRAIGDAAAVIFTAGFSDRIPTSIHQPAATLPLAIFFQLNSPIEEVKNRAYASAVVLTFLVLIISILSRYLSKKLKNH